MKNKTKALIASNIILFLMFISIVILNYKNYKNYISCNNNLIENNKSIEEYKSQIEDLNSKIFIQSQTREGKIEETSKNFLNGFFNFSGRNDSAKYAQIKPYVTENLLNKVKPKEEIESDVEYTSSIKDIKIYKEEQSKDSKTETVLVLADQSIVVKGTTGTPSPILIKLKLLLINDNWIVDDILINRPLKNIKFFE